MMKQLAAKFLNKNGYFPDVQVKAEAFDNHQSVEFKNGYSCSCYANDKTLDIILAYDANTQGVLTMKSSYEFIISAVFTDSNPKVDEKEAARTISLMLSVIATEILKCAAEIDQ